MKTQHTPGPWRHDETWGLIYGGQDAVEVCAIHAAVKEGQRIDRATPTIANANAHLIAAAPDLLQTLQDAQEVLAVALSWPNSDKIRRQIRNAIAKATQL